MTEDTLKTGTTTIGMKLKDGVILATDQRATMGNLIADNHCQKLFPIADNLGMNHSAISHQLRILRSAGLVRPRKDGKTVYYSLDDEHVEMIFKMGLEHILHKDGHEEEFDLEYITFDRHVLVWLVG